MISSDLLSINYRKITKKSQYMSMFQISKDFIEDFISKLSKEKDMFLQLDRALPMIFPPAAWMDVDLGSYYAKPSLILRFVNKNQIKLLKKADLRRLYSCNILFFTNSFFI